MFYTLLTQPLANGLIIFYRLLGNNLGLAIIGFTVFLRFILNPLTKPYMDSMKKIKDYAPQIDKLKKKYSDDKMKFAKAQADFYKEKGINPSSGCLPYLIQIIVLIAFFNVFTKTISNGGDLVTNFNNMLYSPLKFASGEIINTKFLYLDVTKPDVFNIPGISFSLPGLFVIFSALFQFLSAKIQQPVVNLEKKIAKKTPDTTDDIQVQMQKSMIYTFPLMTLFIGTKFSSALAIYWLTFSLIQFYQQAKSGGHKNLKSLFNSLKVVKSSSK